jgi:hypothetical protein
VAKLRAETPSPALGHLRALAEQVLRSVEGRSRLARRHAAALARGVLDAVSHEGGVRGADPMVAHTTAEATLAGRVAPAEGGPGLARRSATLVMAELATLVVDEPEVARSLCAFVGVG